MKKRVGIVSSPWRSIEGCQGSHVLIPFRPLMVWLINSVILVYKLVDQWGQYLLNPTLYSSLQLTSSSSPCVYSLWATLILLPSSLGTYLSYPWPTDLPWVASPTQLHVYQTSYHLDRRLERTNNFLVLFTSGPILFNAIWRIGSNNHPNI